MWAAPRPERASTREGGRGGASRQNGSSGGGCHSPQSAAALGGSPHSPHSPHSAHSEHHGFEEEGGSDGELRWSNSPPQSPSTFECLPSDKLGSDKVAMAMAASRRFDTQQVKAA
jgi:hypothetical protein